MSDFQETKVWLAGTLGLSKDAMHICIGLLVFLLALGLMRARLRDRGPLLAVLVVALAGEAWDLFDTWSEGQRLRWDLSWHDIWVTSLWPAVLFALARFTRLVKP